MVWKAGFEPAAPRVQAEYSDQAELLPEKRWTETDSNGRPRVYQPRALHLAELPVHKSHDARGRNAPSFIARRM